MTSSGGGGRGPFRVSAAPRFEVHLGDCIEWLRTIESESVALAITDPAYESLEKHRAVGTTTRLTRAWFPIFRNERFPELLAELHRVLKRDAHLYLFADQETSFFSKPLAEAAGFVWWKHLTWLKVSRSGEPRGGMGYHYRSATEWIGFYEKGKRKLHDLGQTDVLRGERGGLDAYPTEKPVEVLETLVRQSSEPGDLVIDPFLGSGSTGEAALKLGRDFAGCDVAQQSLQLATERLARFGSEATVVVRRAQRSLW